LARHIDRIGKTLLHHCSEIDPKFGLKREDSLATGMALKKAGADVNSVRIILAMVMSFQPRHYGMRWRGARVCPWLNYC
jgi:hypothetical protein